ncbi:MAG: ribose 5-phosphate isomerase B [Oscillospiraceae bacterium]|nr:ribose 5-phosphate isomerase B [Oscillospiraceae bacterium]
MLALGSDHGGFELKEQIKEHLKNAGVEFKDFGIYENKSADYPDIAKDVCGRVLSGECSAAVLMCGTGIGISIAANKINGIRAALCSDVFSAKMAKQHNNANVLCLGGRVTGPELAFMIVDTWLGEEFLGGRHGERVDKIHMLEKH